MKVAEIQMKSYSFEARTVTLFVLNFTWDKRGRKQEDFVIIILIIKKLTE